MPGKTRGAQPHNANAETHGFYSDTFTREEIKRLANTPLHDLTSEITLQRITNHRLAAAIKRTRDNLILATLATALSNGTGRVARLIQTQLALTGQNPAEAELKAVLDDILEHVN